MCDPVTLTAVGSFFASNAAAISAVAAVGAGAVGVAGNIQQGRAASAAAEYQGQLAEVNAINADRAARDALERGELDALQHGRQVAALRGRQTANVAAAGIEAGFGSPLAVAEDTDLLAAEDLNTIHQNASREADAYRINASNYRAEGVGARMAGKNARSAMILDSASTVLNTATQLGGQYAKYRKRG